MAEKIVQTAGRTQLGEFAPMFAHLNDDVLFGEVWNEEAIDVKTKCIITVVSLMASGITVIPFCTSGGSGIGRSGPNMEALAGSGTWLSGERFSGSVSEADLQSWIEGLK